MPEAGRTTRERSLGKELTSRSLTARRAALIISIFTTGLTLLAGVLAFLVDRDEFPSLGIAFWWAIQTVTTVGYGDFVPQNTGGRVIGSVVMLVGVSFVAVVTASIAAAFVASARRQVGAEPNDRVLATKLDEIASRLERLEGAVERGRTSKPGDA